MNSMKLKDLLPPSLRAKLKHVPPRLQADILLDVLYPSEATREIVKLARSNREIARIRKRLQNESEFRSQIASFLMSLRTCDPDDVNWFVTIGLRDLGMP